MHLEAREFTIFVKKHLSDFFVNKRVLDVGSGDINGNNRFLFENCDYNGNDVILAKNVTIVSRTKDLPFEENSFDTILSTECFEHDPEYKHSFLKIYSMLKPDGLFAFTCASTGRAEHGTRRTTPNVSYGSIGKLDDMIDYYKNLTVYELNYVLNLNELFSNWEAYYHTTANDLYFVGIKKGTSFINLPKYIVNNVVNTKLNIETLESIETIFMKYNTDKNKSFHNYSRQYENIFSNVRNHSLRILEIGVFKGESQKAMREVFKNAKCIVGIDLNNDCKQYEDANANIFVEIGNATDVTLLKTIVEKYGNFDIILDDGSHINKDVIQTFETLFPLLNDNGIYIVEDTICYKTDCYIDSAFKNHLEYFFKYTNFLNQWRFDSTEGIRDNCIDPFKIQKKTTNVFEYSIDKIEYGCSYIAIYKKNRSHWV